jgi:hypothetical protein
MRLLLKLGTGVVVRFFGLLAESFAQWLFHEVSEGAEDSGESLSDIWNFCRWFVRTLAGQLCGRFRHQFDQSEEDYQPGFYGAR